MYNTDNIGTNRYNIYCKWLEEENKLCTILLPSFSNKSSTWILAVIIIITYIINKTKCVLFTVQSNNN